MCLSCQTGLNGAPITSTGMRGSTRMGKSRFLRPLMATTVNFAEEVVTRIGLCVFCIIVLILFLTDATAVAWMYFWLISLPFLTSWALFSTYQVVSVAHQVVPRLQEEEEALARGGGGV
jgi:hypothetical protein